MFTNLLGWFLAIVLSVAALGKFLDPVGSVLAMRTFGVPRSLAGVAGVLLPTTELVIALALVLPATIWWGALGALIFFGLFTCAVTYQVSRGRHPDCNCFGKFGGGAIGPNTLVRNSVFAISAIVILVLKWKHAHPLFSSWLGGASPVEATLLVLSALLVLLVALIAGLMLFVYQRLMRTINLATKPNPRKTVMEPRIPIPQPPRVGDFAPEIELANLHGERTSIRNYLGRETVLIFMQPTCGVCKELLPDLISFEINPPPNAPTMIVITHGTPEENEDYAALRGPTLLAQSTAAAYAFGSSGAPSAVRIDAEGKVASAIVLGPGNVKWLLGLVPTPESFGGSRMIIMQNLRNALSARRPDILKLRRSANRRLEP